MSKKISLEDKFEKLCFINIEGEILIEAQEDFDTIYYPSNGLCLVEKDGRYGYMDEMGQLVIPLIYREAYEFSDNGLAFVVGENGLGGYINKKGEFVINPIYESGSNFNFGFAAVSKDGEYIFIYENGNKAINHTFKYAGGFSECGLAKVQEFDGRQGLMDTKSKPLIMLKNWCELAEFQGESRVTKFRAKGREGLINSKGEIITGLKYDRIIISPNSNLNPFLRNGLWGYIDDEGYEVIANIYLRASEFTEYNLASVGAYNPLVKNNIVNLYINDRDEIIDNKLIELFNKSFSHKFSKVYRFKNGLALAVKREERKRLKSHRYDFMGNPKFKGYYDEEGFAVDIEYEVEIKFRNMGKGDIVRLIRKELGQLEILDVRDNYLKLLWPIEPYGEPEDIEIEMYYLLDDGQLGDYNYYRVN